MPNAKRGRVIVEIPGEHRLYQANDLPRHEAIGVVKYGDRAGALLRNIHTGLYVQANANAIRTLPQHKIIAAMGETNSQ